MVDLEYQVACGEVLEILKYVSEEELNKVPKNLIGMFEASAKNPNNFKYDPSKTLEEQNVSETARGITAILFRDYWATDKQRRKILAKQEYDRELMRKERYNAIKNDNFFQKIYPNP